MPTCACLEGPTWRDISRQQQEAPWADLWELRVDLLDPSALEELEAQVGRLRDRPLLLTDRSACHGGRAGRTLADQSAMRKRLVQMQPEVLDVEWPCSQDMLESLRRHAPQTRILVSWHGQKLPEALSRALERTRDLQPDLWKIAPHCPDAASWVRWQGWWQRQGHLHGRLLLQPQGPLGLLQRLWQDRWRQPWVFLTAQEAQEGRVAPREWTTQFRLPIDGGRSPELYGVVGDPVAQSRGKLFHNSWMASMGWPGRYAPIRCSLADWPRLWPWLRNQAAGLAVTTPLKQAAAQSADQLDALAADTGCVNTLVRCGTDPETHKWIGVNTDGPAAVAVMGGPEALAGAQVLVLGAGGVGRAVALACQRTGAKVRLLARRPEQARDLARWGIEVLPLGSWPELAAQQDWVIQATTCGFLDDHMPVDPNLLRRQNLLEIVQRQTPFQQRAQERGCRVVPGVDMFVELSKLQAQLWTEGQAGGSHLDQAAQIVHGVMGCR